MLQRGKLRPSGTVVRQELPSPAPRPLLRLLLPMGLGAGLAGSGVTWETHGLPSKSLWFGGMTVSASRPTGPHNLCSSGSAHPGTGSDRDAE